MADYNKSILIGRLTADPELKQTQSGVPICSFTIAVNRRMARDQVDFINCIAWRQKAEFLCKYFRKGSHVLVDGSIQTRSWTDQNKQKRYVTEVVADEVDFVDSKGSGKNSEAAETEAAEPQQGAYSTDDSAGFEEVTDEDLPF